MTKRPKIALTGGGTGGHLAIAKSLGEALVARGAEVIFIGSTHGQDRAWFEGESLFSKRFFLPTYGVVNQRGLDRLRSLYAQFEAMKQAKEILKQEGVERVVSVGGYSAAPAALAALVARIPLYIHEQNAQIGTLHRLLKPFARAFFSSYHSDSPLKDYPVGERFFKSARARNRIKHLLFLGGSQGARTINEWALELAPFLKERGITITHQCGAADYERLKASYEALGIEVELFAFSEAIETHMARADLAISRAGASTLWELCANGLPALFIPYPYAAGDHQYHNAKFITDQNLGWVMRQESLSIEGFWAILENDLWAKSEGLRAMVKPGAAGEIADFILA